MDLEASRSLYQRRGSPFNHDPAHYIPPMHERRGRSRQIAPVAIARQASEERRRKLYDNDEELRRRALRKRNASSTPTPCVSIIHARRRTPHRPPLSENALPYGAWLNFDDTATGPSAAVPALVPGSLSRSQSPTPIHTPIDTPDQLDSETDYFSLDRNDTFLSPARTLEDQLYTAYADDNIRLAKTILLKLKGVNVTSDDDPRIDEVKDEDFDECFLPSGGLDLGDCAAYMSEGQIRERQSLQDRQRMERLRLCERRWAEAKERARRERLAAVLLKESENAQAAAKAPRGRKLEADPTTSSRHHRSKIDLFGRGLMAYPSTSLSSTQVTEVTFRYEVMPFTTKPTAPSPRRPQVLERPRSVSFEDVLSSMHGPLFPVDPLEQSHLHGSVLRKHNWGQSWWTSHTQHSPAQSRSSIQAELFASLASTDWEESDRQSARTKGSAACNALRRKPSSSAACAACSASSSSGTSSSLSRSTSWLSVSGLSEPSTCATSPASSSVASSTSPIYSWLKSNAFASITRARGNTSNALQSHLRHSCRPRQQLTAVALADSPLHIASTSRLRPRKQSKCDMPDSYRVSSSRYRAGSIARDATTKDRASVSPLLNCVADILGLAKDFHKSYIGATVLGVSVLSDGCHDRGNNAAEIKPPALRPPGYRARSKDVAAFLRMPLPESKGQSPQNIPLRCSSSPALRPCTAIPSHERIFPPLPALPRSPFRPSEPPSSPSLRLRPIENPVTLRLRALQNVLCERGQRWEGHAPDGALGCGRERLVSIGWDGLGRSALSWESRVVPGF